MEKDKYIVSTLHNALGVVNLLYLKHELGLSEISKETGLSKANVFRLLYTLEINGFVKKTEDLKYKLGIKFAHYGSEVLERNNLYSTAKPYLRRLCDIVDETVHLGILDDNLDVIFMAKELSTAQFRITSSVGIKMPFYATSLGKSIISFKLDKDSGLSDRIKKTELVRLTKNTIINHEVLFKELEITKMRGYGVDMDENQEGLTCFGAPIFDISGDPIAAISVSGPTSRMLSNQIFLIDKLKLIAEEISINFGYKVNK